MVDEKTKKYISFISVGFARDVLIVVVLIVLTWKLINSELQFNIAEFSFTDLLSLILAMFSIGISIAFYFKATDTSNQFYDNSYKFTKDMSEILGRIESGFGEKLKHLDEGYSGIRDRFDKFPAYLNSNKAEVAKEEEEIIKKEKEQNDIFENLATRAQLAEVEKQQIFSQLARTNEELEEARMELRRLNERQHSSSAERDMRRSVVEYLSQKLQEAMPEDAPEKSPSRSLRVIFNNIKEDLHPAAIRDLERLDMLDADGNLSRDTIFRLRMAMKKIQ